MAVYRRTSRPALHAAAADPDVDHAHHARLPQRCRRRDHRRLKGDRTRRLRARAVGRRCACSTPSATCSTASLHYGDLEDENAHLREQLAEQRGARSRGRADAERERQALLDLQDLTFLGDIETISARVVGTSASSFELTAELDKGTTTGIAGACRSWPAPASSGGSSTSSHRRAVVCSSPTRTRTSASALRPRATPAWPRGNGPGRRLSVDSLEAGHGRPRRRGRRDQRPAAERVPARHPRRASSRARVTRRGPSARA